MSDYIPTERAEIVIGVCGEQAAGKTVFLTCIFQSIWNELPLDLMGTLDRDKIGGASYFQGIEDALLAQGPTQGTTERALFPARIYIKPSEAIPGVERSTLAVDLLDFAGRHFRSMADLKHLLEESGADVEETKALREVNAMLERADAFVILINSREIDPMNPAPSRNPFGPSVMFMLAHCLENRKPVALLFSQVDQTPMLTNEVLHEIKTVKRFETQFTENLDEASTPGGRPFGIVRRISCYETLPDDLTPKKHGEGGNIWRPEPAQIVLTLIRATMPTIKAKHLAALAEAERVRQEEELKNQRRRKVRRLSAVAAVAALLIVISVAVFWKYTNDERREVATLERMTEAVQEGNLTGIPSALEADVARILSVNRDNPDGTGSSVRSSIVSLQTAIGEAGERMAGQPLLDAGYATNLARFEGLLSHFDANVVEPWQQTVLPVLTPRRELLSEWFSSAPKERSKRTKLLDEAAQRFNDAGDRAFSTLLSAQSTREKEAEIAGWQGLVDADADVESRLRTIQFLLTSSLQQPDPEFTRLARKALAGHVATTILKRSENSLLREKLLSPLLPDLALFGDGDVRFDVLARDLLNCPSRQECERRLAIVQSVKNDASTNVQSWGSAVENLLRSMLLDLPREERPAIWSAFAASLASSYFFSGRRDAWSEGMTPLHAYVLAVASSDTDWTLELIARLAQHPVYANELDYLNDRLTATEVRRRVVPIYSQILTALSQPQGFLPAEDLTWLSRQLSTALAGRQLNGPLGEITGEINQTLDLVNTVNNGRARGQAIDAVSARRLEKLLRDAHRGHCGALMAHEAPTECSNAA